jgi:hypothetical protein
MEVTYYPLHWWGRGEADGLWTTITDTVPHDLTPSLQRQCKVLHVVTSNLQEGTMPLSTSAQDAVAILTREHDEPTAWADASAVAQLLAHMSALEHLMVQATLTVESILTTHAILMEGAKLEQGGLLPQGFRTVPVHSNGRFFLDPQQIEAALQGAVERHNASKPEDLEQAIHSAAELFKNVVHYIHPFQDGNGRLGRLLIAWVLQPHIGYTLPLVNGHAKARKKFDAVICKMARLSQNVAGPMRSHILECVAYRSNCLASNQAALQLVPV